MKKLVALSVLATSVIASSNVAANVTLGIGAGYSTQPYRGVSNDVIPLPVVSYQGDQFFLQNTKAGYYLWNDGQQKVNMNISYHPQSFKGSDSDDIRMQQLDRRRDTAMMGLGYSVNGAFGQLSADVSADILNRSRGIIGDINYGYAINQDLLTVTPTAGLDFANRKYNDYHFGISGDESRRTSLTGIGTLPAYDAGSSVTPYMGVNVNFALTGGWNLFGIAQHKFLSSQVKDSPMITQSGQTLVGGGVSYSF